LAPKVEPKQQELAPMQVETPALERMPDAAQEMVQQELESDWLTLYN